jgi:hypothetical protein
MPWKQIGKHSYYYRSRREHGRVVSEYIGRGKVGSLLAQLSEIERLQAEEKRAEQKAEREGAEQEERSIRAWFDSIEIVADGVMLAAGFHKHHGQWRRKRDGETSRDDRAEAPREDDLG